MRRPAVKGVRVQSRWQVDLLAGEASWVQMCRACWEGTCATWTCDDGPWALSTKPTGSDPPPSFHSSMLSSLSLLPFFLRAACVAEGPAARDC